MIPTILKSSGSVQCHLNGRGLGHWFVYQFSFLCGYMELCSHKSEKCCDNTKMLSHLSFRKDTSQYMCFVRQARNVVRTYHVTLTLISFILHLLAPRRGHETKKTCSDIMFHLQHLKFVSHHLGKQTTKGSSC